MPTGATDGARAYSPGPRTRPRRTQTARVAYRTRPRSAAPDVSVGAPGRALSGAAVVGSALADAAFYGLYGWVESQQQPVVDYLRTRNRLLSGTGAGPRRRYRGRQRKRAVVASTPVLQPVPVARAAPARDAAPDRQPALSPAALAQEIPRAQPQPTAAAVAQNAVALLASPGAVPAARAAPASAPAPSPSPRRAVRQLIPLGPLFSPGTAPVRLTRFNAPGVASPVLAPVQRGLVTPAVGANPSPARCRCPKRKAGKPGKGFFEINRRGQERRRYWR